MNLKPITRLLQLLQTLQSGQGHNADALAASCGVSRRTIFRDLEKLKAAGIPLQFDAEENRYFIPSTFFLPPTNLTAAEALSIIALASKLGAKGRFPFYEPARSAAMKLESSLPAPMRDELRNITRAIEMRVGPLNPLSEMESAYQQIVGAIAARRVLRMRYDSLTEFEVITTKLRPYRLLFMHRSWYVIGRSSLHSEPRTFNLGRILELTTLKEKYMMPRGFSVDRYLGNAWRMIPGSGRDQQVVVRFQPLVARNVAEVLWHKTQSLEFRPDGTLDFSVRVSGLNEIAWWIMGYGDQAEVLRPVKLRRLIAHRVQNMHQLYNGDK